MQQSNDGHMEVDEGRASAAPAPQVRGDMTWRGRWKPCLVQGVKAYGDIMTAAFLTQS